MQPQLVKQRLFHKYFFPHNCIKCKYMALVYVSKMRKKQCYFGSYAIYDHKGATSVKYGGKQFWKLRNIHSSSLANCFLLVPPPDVVGTIIKIAI